MTVNELEVAVRHQDDNPSLAENCNELKVRDLDELDESASGLLVSSETPHAWLTLPNNKTLDLKTEMELKKLLFGSPKRKFPIEWEIQDFNLDTHTKIGYGIVQKKGGPCGVLACVQAYLIRELMFQKARRRRRRRRSSSRSEEYSEDECKKCLALALAHILWKCGSQQRAIIAMTAGNQNGINNIQGSKTSLDNRLRITEFTDLPTLQCFLGRHVSLYTGTNGRACILFLYSAILSRGIDEVRKDMDDPNTRLISTVGYCSQEVINLFLTGFASSNVFDNVTVLDEGLESQSVFKGVMERSEIGFLALFEHYNSCQVGAFLKCPLYPIWIVCSESHFSVLFAKDYSVCDKSKVAIIRTVLFNDLTESCSFSEGTAILKYTTDNVKDKVNHLRLCGHGNNYDECCGKTDTDSDNLDVHKDSDPGHCHRNGRQAVDRKARRRLIIASIMCLMFMIAEVIGGYLAGSLAVMTDADHLLTDFASLSGPFYSTTVSIKRS